MLTNVIDISKHNGSIDFAKVKADGISGVIIRAGYGKHISQKDPSFEKYYAAAKTAGINVGAYWYSYALSVPEAKLEAAAFLEAVKDKHFELPMYFDIEEEKQVALGKTICSAMADAFCGAMEQAGYFAGVYSFDSFFGSSLSENVQKKYTCWVARVENVKPAYCKKYDMHQYTWKGSVKGAANAIDISYCYRDFPMVIKKAGLNGFGKKKSVTARMANLSKAKADEVADACARLGMTTVISEEE